MCPVWAHHWLRRQRESWSLCEVSSSSPATSPRPRCCQQWEQWTKLASLQMEPQSCYGLSCSTARQFCSASALLVPTEAPWQAPCHKARQLLHLVCPVGAWAAPRAINGLSAIRPSGARACETWWLFSWAVLQLGQSCLAQGHPHSAGSQAHMKRWTSSRYDALPGAVLAVLFCRCSPAQSCSLPTQENRSLQLHLVHTSVYDTYTIHISFWERNSSKKRHKVRQGEKGPIRMTS